MSNLEFDEEDLDILVNRLVSLIHKNTDDNDLHSINSIKCKDAIKKFLSNLTFKVEVWSPLEENNNERSN